MLRRLLLIAAALVVSMALALGATSAGRTAVKTALLLPEMVPALPQGLQRRLAPEPARQSVSFQFPDGASRADLYTPAGQGPHGAVVLFLGINPAGPEDPRVTGLARALARAGMAVLIPWSEQMVEGRLSYLEVERLVAAFEYLQGHEEIDPNRVGLGGFCVGASVALVAAADLRIADSVAFVNFFGGYFDLGDLVAQAASRTAFYGETERPWDPDAMTAEAVRLHILEGISDPQEREMLAGSGPDAAIEDLASLSPGGMAVADLLAGPTLAEALDAVERLPSGLRDEMASLSPSRALASLKAPVLAMADAADPLVPSEESRRLAMALEPRGQVRYTEFSLFQHVDPTRPLGPLATLRELGRLYTHMYRVLEAGA